MFHPPMAHGLTGSAWLCLDVSPNHVPEAMRHWDLHTYLQYLTEASSITSSSFGSPRPTDVIHGWPLETLNRFGEEEWACACGQTCCHPEGCRPGVGWGVMHIGCMKQFWLFWFENLSSLRCDAELIPGTFMFH